MHNKPHSEATKNKLRLIFKGKKKGPLSESIRNKISIANKGKKGSYGHQGKKHSEESKKKMSESRMGKSVGSKNPSWKGGITKFTQKIRTHSKYEAWISEVFARDNYTCQKCGVRGGDLEAHHINRFSDIIHSNNIKSLADGLMCSELWDVGNGQTLCVDCHNRTKSI